MAEKLTVKKLQEMKKILVEADRKMPRVYIDGEEYVLLKPNKEKSVFTLQEARS